MEEDIVVNAYFSDNARFADLINGLVFGGRQHLLRRVKRSNHPIQGSSCQNSVKTTSCSLVSRWSCTMEKDIFRTDIKLVFDVIRCSEDDEKLEALIKGNLDYGHLKEDAYMLIEKYIGIKKFISARKKYKNGDEVDMCKALIDMQARYRNMGREEGREEGRLLIIHQMLKEGMDKVVIQKITRCTDEEYRKAGKLKIDNMKGENL